METVFLFRDFIVICMIYVNNYAKNLREHAQGLVCVLTRNQRASLMRNRLNYRQPIFISREVILIFFFHVLPFFKSTCSPAHAQCVSLGSSKHIGTSWIRQIDRGEQFSISRERSVGFFFCLVWFFPWEMRGISIGPVFRNKKRSFIRNRTQAVLIK